MDPEHRDRLTATIGLLTTDEQTRRRVIEIAQPFGEVLTTRAWRDFVNMVEPADCAVIDIGHSDVTLAAWPALINERLATELILIVPSDPCYLRLLASVRACAVLTPDELSTELRRTIGALVRPSFLDVFASRVHGLTHLPVSLRTALLVACRSDVPITSVNRLASRVGCSAAILQKQWRAAVNGGIRLEDFMNWVLVVRVHERHGKSIARNAQAAGISPRRIYRWLPRLRTILDIEGEEDVSVHGGDVIFDRLCH